MNASELYTQAVVIDGLNVSNWESPTVYSSLRQGGFTAINATVATWENFQETMDHIAIWLRRFDERDDILQVKEVADHVFGDDRPGFEGLHDVARFFEDIGTGVGKDGGAPHDLIVGFTHVGLETADQIYVLSRFHPRAQHQRLQGRRGRGDDIGLGDGGLQIGGGGDP